MAKNTPWKKAIEQILKEAGTSMHYKDIASQILADGLRTNIGATPAATVSANLTTSIKQGKENSPFRKVGRGEYVLRSLKPEKKTLRSKGKRRKLYSKLHSKMSNRSLLDNA